MNFGSGSDTASGTEEAPLKTVAKALEDVAAGKATNIVLRAGVHILGATLELTPAHSGATLTAYCSGTAPCEQVWLSGGVPLDAGGSWTAHDTTGGRNIWARPVPAAAVAAGTGAQSSLHWLEDLDGATALTRARYPNRRPADGTVDKPSLLDITATTAVWEQPLSVRPSLHKQVDSPSIPLTVTGEFNKWMEGVGGECDRFDPPAAAICHPNATGGGYNWDGPGPFFPTGLRLGNATNLFPNSSEWADADMSQAVFTSWTNGWFTSHFDIESFRNGTLTFGRRGGIQGGRGWHFPAGSNAKADVYKICTGNVRGTDCGPVRIEGLMAELDAPDEYHIARESATLYLFYNTSATGGAPPPDGAGGVAPPPAGRTLVVPALQQLVSIRGGYAGAPAAARPTAAVVNITLRHLGFRDSSPSFLEPHGIPSGGDCSR